MLVIANVTCCTHTSTHSGSHSVYTVIKIMLIVNHFQAIQPSSYVLIQPSSYVLIPNLALPRLQALITCSMQNWKCSKSGGGEWGSVSESYQSGNESVSESYQSENEAVYLSHVSLGTRQCIWVMSVREWDSVSAVVSGSSRLHNHDVYYKLSYVLCKYITNIQMLS